MQHQQKRIGDLNLVHEFETETEKLESFETAEKKADLDDVECNILNQIVPSFKQIAFVLSVKFAIENKREISELEKKLTAANTWPFEPSTDTLDMKSKLETMISAAHDFNKRFEEYKEKYRQISIDLSSEQGSEVALNTCISQWCTSYTQLQEQIQSIHEDIANITGVALPSQCDEIENFLKSTDLIALATRRLMDMQACINEDGSTSSSTMDVTITPKKSILLADLESLTSDMKEFAALDEDLTVLSKIFSLLETYLKQAISWTVRKLSPRSSL